MKKFIIKIFLFFIAVALCDTLFGIACQYMNDHSKGGGVKSRYYVCKESTEDILIFGSSRAKHHYVPDIIEDSLGMSCYNTGEDGNGIIYCYGILKMITQRYSPKLIIFDVTRFDIEVDDNMKYLDLLKPYYYEPGVDSIFWAIEPKTRFMMLSNLYRYNTTCIRVIGNFVRPMSACPKGYSALYQTMNYDPEVQEKKTVSVDSLKIQLFEKFIQLTKGKGIKMICCVSPFYKALPDDDNFEPVKRLCREHGVPFFYFGAEPNISNDKKLFQDKSHLNDNGARVYTSGLMERIK